MNVTDYDPRIVDLYDQDNPDGPDHDFYRALADDLHAQTILDIGCGTGILTVTLTDDDRRVVGVDPSAAMIAFARDRRGAELVTWIEGDSSNAPHEVFDLAIMTGNVAQHIADADWERTLRDLRQRMTVGGTIAFESRNPVARAWESWASGAPTTRETPHGTLIEWMDVELIDDRTVHLAAHNTFVRSGETVTMVETLIFRTSRD